MECKTAGDDNWQPAKIREWVSKSHSGAQNGRSTSGKQKKNKNKQKKKKKKKEQQGKRKRKE